MVVSASLARGKTAHAAKTVFGGCRPELTVKTVHVCGFGHHRSKPPRQPFTARCGNATKVDQMAKNVSPARLAKLVEAVDRPGVTAIDVDIAPDGTVKIAARRAPEGETDGDEAFRRWEESQRIPGHDERHS